MPSIRRGAGAAAFACAVTAFAALTMLAEARAGAQDYRFEAAGPPVKSGKTTIIEIRLVHLPDGKPVSGAVIFQTRFDMGPEGMTGMTAPASVSVTAQTGAYQISAEPQAGGNWALSLSAKVPGEAEPVRGTITVAVPK